MNLQNSFQIEQYMYEHSLDIQVQSPIKHDFEKRNLSSYDNDSRVIFVVNHLSLVILCNMDKYSKPSIKLLDVKKMTEKIKSVHINPATMHADEREHLARIFFVEIMQNGWYGMDEVDKILKNLPYSDQIKNNIKDIAEVICNLRDMPETRGRRPDGYVDIMKKILT